MGGTPEEAWAAQALARISQGGRDPMDFNAASELGEEPLLATLHSYYARQMEEERMRREYELQWAKLIQQANQFDSTQDFEQNVRFPHELAKQDISTNAQGKMRMAELAAKAREETSRTQAQANMERERTRQAGQLETERERRARMNVDPTKVLGLQQQLKTRGDLSEAEAWRQATNLMSKFQRGEQYEPADFQKQKKPGLFSDGSAMNGLWDAAKPVYDYSPMGGASLIIPALYKLLSLNSGYDGGTPSDPY